MKRRDLERRLRDLGWRFVRAGKKHDIWGRRNDEFELAIPRHTEIKEPLAKSLLADASRK